MCVYVYIYVYGVLWICWRAPLRGTACVVNALVSAAIYIHICEYLLHIYIYIYMVCCAYVDECCCVCVGVL